jgi:hypothetical protein
VLADDQYISESTEEGHKGLSVPSGMICLKYSIVSEAVKKSSNLMEQKVHYRFIKNRPLNLIVTQLNPVLLFTPYSLSFTGRKSSIFWDITPCSTLKITDVSEEHVAFIFRVEE